MAIKLKSYRSRLLEKLIIPSEAEHYINAALKDSPEMFLEAVKDVAQARQMAHVAKKSGMAREALYRSLSRRGNPTFETLISVLKALGMRFDRVECLPSATRNTNQKVKPKRKSTPVFSAPGSGKSAILMQSGLGWGLQSNTFRGAEPFVEDMNAYGNADSIGLTTLVSAEQQAVTIDHLIHEGMTHGAGQAYTGNQGNYLQEK